MTGDRIAVIGAGPAGMRAALTLVAHGAKPVVIDEAVTSGGQIYRRPPESLAAAREPKTLYGFEASKARRLHAAFDALGNRIDYRPASTVWSVDENRISLVCEGRADHVHWDGLILATGAMDRIIPIKGWTLPGAYSLGAAQIGLKAQAVAIGSRVVFFGTGPLLYLVAYQYAKAGLDVGAVLDTSPLPSTRTAVKLVRGGATFAKGLYYVAWLKTHGVRIERGVRPLEILEGGDRAVSGIRYENASGKVQTIDTPAVAFGYGLKSETQIADLLGLEFAFDPVQRQWLPTQDADGRSSHSRVYLAGDGASIRGADLAELTGERAALALLADWGKRDLHSRITALNLRIGNAAPFRKALEEAFPFPGDLARRVSNDVMLCRCEGLTAQTIRAAVAETGECEINRLKAFTRLGMGRCQGRICIPGALEVAAAAGGVPIEDAGRVRGQAPIKPVPLSVLAEALR